MDDGEYKLSLLISFGTFLGLRIGDYRNLRWNEVLDKSELILCEGKTKKRREVKLNSQLQKHIQLCYDSIQPYSREEPIFLSQKKTVFTIQRLNVMLKELKARYNLKIHNFSTHSLRKTFGRKVFESSGVNAELALVKLSYLFNHSNTTVTRRYLGIAREELMGTYDLLSF